MIGRIRAAGTRVHLGLALAALGVLLGTGPSQVPATSSFAKASAAAKWMAGYYRQPEPQRLGDALNVLSVEGAFRSDARFMMTAAFLAGVIDGDASVVGPLVAHAANAGSDQKSLVAHAVVLSNRREDLLPGITVKLKGTQAAIAKLQADAATADALRNPIGTSQTALNFYWAYFMASGSEKALAAIIESVAGTLQDADVQALATGYAAKWSLASNAIHDAKVMQTCRAAVAEGGLLAPMLKDIVAAAEAGDAIPVRREWQTAMRNWKARQERAPELSATAAKRGV